MGGRGGGERGDGGGGGGGRGDGGEGGVEGGGGREGARYGDKIIVKHKDIKSRSLFKICYCQR